MKRHWEFHGLQTTKKGFANRVEYLSPIINIGTVYKDMKATDLQVQAMNVEVPDLISSPGKGLQYNLNKNMELAHAMTKHSGRAMQSFGVMKKAWDKDPQRVFRFASFDIETLGTHPSTEPGKFRSAGFDINDPTTYPGHKAKFFSISEIGLSEWEIGKNFQTKQLNRGRDLSLVGYVDDNTIKQLTGLLDDLEKGTKHPYMLTMDERRTLKDLLKYQDEGMFRPGTVETSRGTRAVNIFNAGAEINLPLETFNAKEYVPALRKSLQNLRENRNSLEDIAHVLSDRLGLTNNYIDGIIGHNISNFDMPMLANFFFDHGQTQFAEGIKEHMHFYSGGYGKYSKAEKLVLDTQVMLDMAFPDFVHEVASTIKNPHLKAGYLASREGQMTVSLLSKVYGFGDQTHLALSDTLLPPKILDQMGNKVYDAMEKQYGRMTKGSPNPKEIFRTVSVRDEFLATAGLPGHQVGEFDSVYKFDKTMQKYIPAYEGWDVSKGGLYKNARYQVAKLDYIQGGANNPFQHKYGSFFVALKNLDDDLIHTFIREDNAAGTGIGAVEDLFNRYMRPITKQDDALILSEDVKVLEDKAMRRYRGLFEVEGSYNKTRQFYEASNKYQGLLKNQNLMDRNVRDNIINEITKLESAAGARGERVLLDTPAKVRDFVMIGNRLGDEYAFMKPLFDVMDENLRVGNITSVDAKMGLVTLRNIMEGRHVVPTGTGEVSLGQRLEEVLSIDPSHTRMKGDLRMNIGESLLDLSPEKIDNSIKAVINREGWQSTLQELKRNGLLSDMQYGDFYEMFEGNKTTVWGKRGLASLLKKLSPEQLEDVRRKEYRMSTSYNKAFQSLNQQEADIIRSEVWKSVEDYSRRSSIERESRIKAKIDLRNPTFVGMLDKHKKALNNELNWTTSKIAKPTSINQQLEELVNAYTGSDTSVRFLKGANDNLIEMVVFRNSDALSLANLSPEELLQSRKVVSIHIPLLNDSGMLEVGSQRRVNVTRLVGSNLDDVKAMTGTDLIIEAYKSRSGRIKDLLKTEGRTFQESKDFMMTARNSANMAFNEVFKDFAGIGTEEIEQSAFTKMTSESAKKWRNQVIDISGIYKLLYGVDYEQTYGREKLINQIKTTELIKSKLDLDVNFLSMKESWAVDGTKVAIGNVRGLYAFSEFSRQTGQLLVQNLNMRMVSEDNFIGREAAKRKALGQFVVTKKGIEFFGMDRGGRTGGANIETLFMDSYDMSVILDEMGIQGAKRPTLYEGRSLISEQSARDLAGIQFKEFTVKGETVGSITEDAIVKKGTILGIDNVTGEEIKWRGTQDLTIAKMHAEPGGATKIIGYYEAKVGAGTRIGSEMDKTTTTVADHLLDKWMKELGVGAVENTVAKSKGYYGGILKAQTALIVHHIDQLTTIGSVEKDELRFKLAQYYNEFFNLEQSAEKFEIYKGPGAFVNKALVVPERIIADGKHFNYGEMYKGVFARIGTDIDTALGGKGTFDIGDLLTREVKIGDKTERRMVGLVNTGAVPLDEDWYRGWGFKNEEAAYHRGIKFAPKSAEIMYLMDLDKTAGAYQQLVRHSVKTQFGEEVLGTATKSGISEVYYNVAKTLVRGEVDVAEDVFVRINELGKSPHELSIGSFERTPRLDPLDQITPDRYRYSIMDIDKFRRAPYSGIAHEGGMTKEIAERAWSRGSIVLELPEKVTVGSEAIDMVRLSVGAPDVRGGNIASLTSLNKASLGVMDAVKDYLAGPIEGIYTKETLYGRMQAAVGRLYDTTAKDISSSHGYLQEKILSSRLAGTGYATAQMVDPFEKIAGRTTHAGFIEVNEKMFEQLFAGHDNIKSLRQMASLEHVQQGGEALYAIVGRNPYTSQHSQMVQRLIINKDLSDGVAKIGVIEWLMAGGDSDKDPLSIMVSHYDHKFYDKVEGISQAEVLGELKRRSEVELQYKKGYEKIIQDQVAGQSKFTISSLMEENIVNRVPQDLESTLARSIRMDIGAASNLNTSVRRMAQVMAMNESITGFTREEAKIVSSFFEAVEQNPISGKHLSYDDLLKQMFDISVDQASAEQSEMVLQRMRERVTIGSEMIKAAKNQNLDEFARINKKYRIIDPESLQGKHSIKLPGTIDEYYKAINKLWDLSGDTSKVSSFGTKSGVPDLAQALELLESGRYQSVLLEQTRELSGMSDGILDRLHMEHESFLQRNVEALKGGYGEPSPLPDGMKFTVGSEAINETRAMARRGTSLHLGGFASGALAFSGLMLATGLISSTGLSNKVDHDIAIGEGGYALQPPIADIAGPTARVVREGTGYENIQISIKARDMAGMTQEEIGGMVQNQISGMMPMDVNFNISKRDNSQRLDDIWVQQVMNNAINKGYGY